MPPEETPAVVATPEASAPAEKTAETPAATPETSKATTDDSKEPSLLDDVKAAREAEEAKGKPEAKTEEKAKEEAEAKKSDDEKEPEGLTEAEKNRAAWIKAQRDTQLQESAKLAEERKALDAEKAELEKAKLEIAAKPKTDEAKESKVDQPAAAALENFKPITLSSYDDGDNENEQALKTGIESLAKDLQAVKTEYISEIERLKADNKRLMDLAAPYIPDETGVAPAEMNVVVHKMQTNAIKASETLMGEFGPDSGLKLAPENLMAAFQEFASGFIRIGEIKLDTTLSNGQGVAISEEAILHCWRHANKAEIDKAKGTPAKAKEEKQVPPPIRKEEGKAAQQPSYDDMTEREKVLYDIREAEALASNGQRR